jgi:fatty acid desaturase
LNPTDQDRRPTGLQEARAALVGLFVPSRRQYWSDLLASALVGWAAFAVAASAPLPVAAAAFVVAVFALYRALLFIHELTHLREGAIPGFRTAWNLLVGFPLLVPSITYEGVHTDHHRRSVYGTPADPEYLPLARAPRRAIVRFLLDPIAAPSVFILRFLVAGPLSWFVPPLRRWLEQRASSLVINLRYVRPPLDDRARRRLRAAEAGTFAYAGAAFGLAALGAIPARAFLVWLLVSTAIALVNQFRTVVAHRFASEGGELDVVGQLTDTVNIPGGLLTGLWAPVGLRYHALHHWLPDLPYHALPEAHRRLLAALPPEAPYRGVQERGFPAAFAALWAAPRTRDACPAESPR